MSVHSLALNPQVKEFLRMSFQQKFRIQNELNMYVISHLLDLIQEIDYNYFMSVFLNFSGKTFALSNDDSLQGQIVELFQNLRIDYGSINYRCNSKPFSTTQKIDNYSVIHVSIPLLGGKGGYGAKLKNQGGKKVRPNDNRFSRDAQGRRIEYQMAQRQYTQFVKRKMQQDEKVNRQREQFKVMQQTMKQGSSFMKLDKKYNEEVQKTENQIAESIKIGKEKLAADNKAKMNGVHHNGGLLNKNNCQTTTEENNEEKKEKVENGRIEGNQEEEKQQLKEEVEKKEEEKQEKEIKQLEKPVKKVKFDLNPVELTRPQQSFVSAKGKLKSLFKK